MKHILNCRRSTVSVIAIICLTWLGLAAGTDVSIAIAGICASLSGANAYEKRNTPAPVKEGDIG